MYISRKYFLIISLLFFLVPFSAQWRLLLFGEKTKGTVVRYVNRNSRELYTTDLYTRFSVIRFETPNRYYEITGPEDVIYPLGKTITLYYDKGNPEKIVLFSFTGLFFSNKMIVPGVLLLMWFAFYITMRQLYPHPPSINKNQVKGPGGYLKNNNSNKIEKE
jgi:hypothetical protein